MAQRIRIIMIPPTLRSQKNAGAYQRSEIVGHIDLAARVLQPLGHPRHDPAAFHDLAQHHRPRIARQPI